MAREIEKVSEDERRRKKSGRTKSPGFVLENPVYSVCQKSAVAQTLVRM